MKKIYKFDKSEIKERNKRFTGIGVQCTLYSQKLRLDSPWEIYAPLEGKLSTQLLEVVSYFVISTVCILELSCRAYLL